MLRSALLLIAATTTTALAQPATVEPSPPSPPKGFVAGGILLGGDHLLNAALIADGGIQITSAPVWLHGLVVGGNSFDFEGGGSMWRAAIGVELRSSGTYGNLFTGFDVGFQHQRWEGDDFDPPEEHEGAYVGGRIGVDAGGEHVRFRAAVDVYRYHHALVNSADNSHQWEAGGDLTLGLAYRM